MAARTIAVIGAAACDERVADRARAVGRLLAEAGCVVVTGGLGGVMKAASRGAKEAGGLVVGIVPGPDPTSANGYVDVAIATGMGDARNAILANTAEAFVAVAGSWGTLSEIAFALKRGKRVVALEVQAPGLAGTGQDVIQAEGPEEAVRLVLAD